MKVVAALDAFKGSLSSVDAGEAVRAGVLAVDPAAQVVVRAVADGGEGTLAALMDAHEGEWVPTETVDALGRPLTAEIGVFESDGRRTAVVEAARTIGLSLVPVADGDTAPRASSYGMGVQLAAALSLDVDRVVVALGGTTTTDGGAGLLGALGATLVDDRGRQVDGAAGNPLWAGALLAAGTLPRVGTQLCVLTDVLNPLVGPHGAATVFGPQKGASPEQVRVLESRLAAWADSLEAEVGTSLRTAPGAGAAGGVAAALAALGGVFRPGFDTVADETGLAEVMEGAELVITGEGSVDAQTAWGKAPAGVARLGRSSGAIVVAFGGRVERTVEPGVFDAVLPIHSCPRSMPEAMDASVTASELSATARELVRLATTLRGL